MNFTNNRLKREMKRRPRQAPPRPAAAPQGCRCTGCPYWQGIRCVTCFRALLGRGR